MKKSTLGIGTVIFAIFLTLKLAEIGVVKYWSWWWVFSPFWLPMLLVIALLIFCAIFGIDLKYRQPQRKSNFQQRLEEMAKQRKK